MRRRWRLSSAIVGPCVLAALVACLVAPAGGASTTRAAAGTCNLGNGIKHVIYLQFDNTHLTRDRPGVPSDLENMPNLLSLLTNYGTVSDNEHTVLISHTSNGILSSLTGLYPDRHGVTVGNSYRYYRNDGSGLTNSAGAFNYWTDLVDTSGNPPADANYNMVNGDSGSPKNTPAPWVPYTRANCDFGAVSLANIELENTGTGPNGDMTKVFGTGSPEWTEAQQSTANNNLALTDFVGIAIHCASGGGICAGNGGAKPDQLPDEPGGYSGFQALFGAKYVNPAITGGSPSVNNMFGMSITDPAGRPGFPGFDGASAANTLGEILQMQKAGVPVTFGYISDAHDKHTLVPAANTITNQAYGPGEAGFLQALGQYDLAFKNFFQQAAAMGLNTSNTLFVITADENDHFAGGNSADGTWSHTFCNLVPGGQTCPANQIGEVNLNIASVIPGGQPTFTLHSDSAPTIYVNGNPPRTDPGVRKLERDIGAAVAVNPYAGTYTPTPVTMWLADPVEEKALHMVNADPLRTPTFTQFANPDYFIVNNQTTPNSINCGGTQASDCVAPDFAWSHGDATEDIGRTWLGMVGPGVQNLGRTSNIWSDHTDIRPTMLNLLGLKDMYVPDGRVLTEELSSSAIPSAVAATGAGYTILSNLYKQLTAPFHTYAKNTLASSTLALKSNDANDATYTSIENQIQSLTAQRDTTAAAIRNVLNNAAFNGIPLDFATALPLYLQAQSEIAASAALPH